jgi:hypothetical protein
MTCMGAGKFLLIKNKIKIKQSISIYCIFKFGGIPGNSILVMSIRGKIKKLSKQFFVFWYQILLTDLIRSFMITQI